MNNLQLSVLVPLYNAGPFIAAALESIGSQTVGAKEIIVINDGSTDEGPEIVKTFSSVTLLHQENKGCASALNKGLGIATGDYLAFLDADDLWLPEKTELQLQMLKAHPDLDMVFCQCRRFRSDKIEGIWKNTPLDVVVGLSKTGMLIKKTSFEKAGRFPTTDKAHDFMDWFARAKEAGLRYEVLPEILTERRIHDRNHGILRRDYQQQTYFKTLKNMLDRRREKNQEP